MHAYQNCTILIHSRILQYYLTESDGGNEVGMGQILKTVQDSNIPNAKQIACVTTCTSLFVASVSNWGGYALAASLSILQARIDFEANKSRGNEIAEDYLTSKINKLIPPTQSVQANSKILDITKCREQAAASMLISKADEANILAKMVEMGARDGVTGERALFVDGEQMLSRVLFI